LSTVTKVKPFLKWAGGKYRLFAEIQNHFIPAKRLVEPFFGAGSIALNSDFPSVLANDLQTDLLTLWYVVKNHPKPLVRLAKEFFEGGNDVDVFYARRQEFNDTKDPMRRSALFVYLNRHCFNGLCRFNSQGNFNVPFGRYKTVYFPEKEILSCSEKAKNFDFTNQDFREVFKQVTPEDLVYCDPPYIPLSATASFSDYTGDGFEERDHYDLASCAYSAAKKGATVIISNQNNSSLVGLYKAFGAVIHEIDVKRFISGKAQERNSVTEILAVFSSQKENI